MIDFSCAGATLLQFPAFAGGKFISNCLSLSRGCVPQDKETAKRLIQTPDDYDYRSAVVLSTLPPDQNEMSQWRNRFELGDDSIYGLKSLLTWSSGQADATNDPEFMADLTASGMKFFITAHDGALQVLKLLQIWPRASVIKLTNFYDFQQRAILLKNNSAVDPNGDYSQHKYEILAGGDWPAWNDFMTAGFDSSKFPGLDDHIRSEIDGFYPWPQITNPVHCFDMDNNIWQWDRFCPALEVLYQQLGLDDFRADLIRPFWQKYRDLHQ